MLKVWGLNFFSWLLKDFFYFGPHLNFLKIKQKHVILSVGKQSRGISRNFKKGRGRLPNSRPNPQTPSKTKVSMHIFNNCNYNTSCLNLQQKILIHTSGSKYNVHLSWAKTKTVHGYRNELRKSVLSQKQRVGGSHTPWALPLNLPLKPRRKCDQIDDDKLYFNLRELIWLRSLIENVNL